MTIITRPQFKTQRAIDFWDSLSRENSPEHLYSFLGKQTAWDNESSPPPSSINDEQEIETRTNIFALKRIIPSGITFVVPRINWTTGVTYAKYLATDNDLNEKEFYVITSSYSVYKCIGNNNNSPSTIQPSGTSVIPINTADGYVWKFMYNLSSAVILNFLTTSWLPVPFLGQKTAFQNAVENAAIYQNGSPIRGHGYSAINELFCNSIMVTSAFSGSESAVIPTDTSYRQVGLINNPTLQSSGLQAEGTVYSVGDTNSDINIMSGQLLGFENSPPVSRSVGQNDTIKIVLSF